MDSILSELYPCVCPHFSGLCGWISRALVLSSGSWLNVGHQSILTGLASWGSSPQVLVGALVLTPYRCPFILLSIYEEVRGKVTVYTVRAPRQQKADYWGWESGTHLLGQKLEWEEMPWIKEAKKRRYSAQISLHTKSNGTRLWNVD